MVYPRLNIFMRKNELPQWSSLCFHRLENLFVISPQLIQTVSSNCLEFCLLMAGNKRSGALWRQSGHQKLCRISVGACFPPRHLLGLHLCCAESGRVEEVTCFSSLNWQTLSLATLKPPQRWAVRANEGTPGKRVRQWEQDAFSQLDINLLFNANWAALPRSALGGLVQDHALLRNFWGSVRQHEKRSEPRKGWMWGACSWSFTNCIRLLWSDVANPSL